MRQKLFANRAIPEPRQLRFRHTLDPRGYWGSLPTLNPHQAREMLWKLSVDRCWLNDPSELAIATFLGVMPIGYDQHTVHDLTSIMEIEKYFPSTSNRVLQRMARDIRIEVAEDARDRGIPADQIHRCPHHAWSRRENGHMSAPPWLSDQHTLNMLEKTVRMQIFELWPALRVAEDIEAELYHLTSKIFLATGWHLLNDAEDRLPHPRVLPADVQEWLKRGHEVLDAFNGINWREFIDAMMLPSVIFEMGDQNGILVPTEEGMFLDVDDLGADEIQLIYDGVSELQDAARLGRDPYCMPDYSYDPICYGHIERLHDFIRSTQTFRPSPSPAATAERQPASAM